MSLDLVFRFWGFMLIDSARLEDSKLDQEDPRCEQKDLLNPTSQTVQPQP